MNSGKVPTDGGESLAQNPFAKLSGGGLPAGPLPPVAAPRSEPAPARNRGRVDVRRETGGRAGKTVTVADGFVGIGLSLIHI